MYKAKRATRRTLDGALLTVAPLNHIYMHFNEINKFAHHLNGVYVFDRPYTLTHCRQSGIQEFGKIRLRQHQHVLVNKQTRNPLQLVDRLKIQTQHLIRTPEQFLHKATGDLTKLHSSHLALMKNLTAMQVASISLPSMDCNSNKNSRQKGVTLQLTFKIC